MLYILAILFPPIAIYLVAIIHAIIAVHDYRQTKRDERLIKAARGDK